MPRQPQFRALVRSTQGELRDLVAQWHDGRLTLDELGEEMHAALQRAHADAYELGLRQAGSTLGDEARHELAARRGRAQADAENEFFDKFLDDLDAGRYTNEEGDVSLRAIGARSDMYGHKLRATAGQGFVDGSPQDATFTWALGVGEHCSQCPLLASQSPYTADELWTMPGQGDTECLTGCRCHLVRDDGVASFRRP